MRFWILTEKVKYRSRICEILLSGIGQYLLGNMPANDSTFSNYLSQEKAFRSDRETYLLTLFNISCAFLVLGAVENIIVCCVLATGKVGRSPTTKLSNFFILHLSITDLVFRAITFLQRKKLRENLDSSSTVHCQLVIFSQFTCAAVTFVLLTGIAIDRYIHILFPLRALTIKTRKYIIVVFIWFYALVICSGFISSASLSPRIKLRRQPYLLSNSSSKSTSNDTAVNSDPRPFHRHCAPGKPDSLERKVAFTVYFVFAFVVPLIVITFAYTKITVFLWKRTKMTNSINSSCAKAKLKATQMLVVVVFSFLLSWGPIMILDIFQSYPAKKGKITYQKLPMRPLFDCISLTSSIFYPFIYAFCDKNFRKNLGRCLCRKDSVRVTRVSPVIMNNSNIQMSNLSPKVPRVSPLTNKQLVMISHVLWNLQENISTSIVLVVACVIAQRINMI